jgi:protein TonB
MRYWIKIGFTLVMMFCYQSVQAQSSNDTLIDGEPYPIDPEFPGGWENFYIYIVSNVKDPKNFKGREFILDCEVDTLGGLHVLKITPRYNFLLNKELIRVLEASPKFIPAYFIDKKINYRFTIPIRFQN